MYNSLVMKFCDLLTHYREASRLNKKELAERVNVSAAYISNAEKGREVPTLAKCRELATVLSLDKSETQKFIDAAMEERLTDEALQWLHERSPKASYVEDMLKSIPPETLRLLHDPEVIEVLSDERAVKFIKVMAKGQKINAEDFRAFLADLTNMKKEKLSALIRLLQIG